VIVTSAFSGQCLKNDKGAQQDLDDSPYSKNIAGRSNKSRIIVRDSSGVSSTDKSGAACNAVYYYGKNEKQNVRVSLNSVTISFQENQP